MGGMTAEGTGSRYCKGTPKHFSPKIESLELEFRQGTPELSSSILNELICESWQLFATPQQNLRKSSSLDPPLAVLAFLRYIEPCLLFGLSF